MHKMSETDYKLPEKDTQEWKTDTKWPKKSPED